MSEMHEIPRAVGAGDAQEQSESARRAELVAQLTGDPAWLHARTRSDGGLGLMEALRAIDGALALVPPVTAQSAALGDATTSASADALDLARLHTARQVIYVWAGQTAGNSGAHDAKANEGTEAADAHALADTAYFLAVAGRGEAGLALAASPLVAQPWARSAALVNVAAALTRPEQLDHALALAHSIGVSAARDGALYALVRALADVGRLDDAEGAVAAIAETFQRDRASVLVVAALARRGNTDRALVQARAITSAYLCDEALGRVAGALAERGRLEEALALASSLGPGPGQLEGYRHVIAALCGVDVDGPAPRPGQVAPVGGVARALTVAAGRPAALTGVAEQLAHTGRLDDALAIARARHGDYHHCDVLLEVAGALAKAGDPRSGATFDEALSVARASQRPSVIARKLAQAAAALDGVSDGRAMMVAAEAVATARRIHIALDRDDTLAAVAYALAAAAGLAREAEAAAVAIVDADERASALGSAAAALACANDVRAAAVLDEALAAAASVDRAEEDEGEQQDDAQKGDYEGESTDTRGRLLGEVAQKLAEAGVIGEAQARLPALRELGDWMSLRRTGATALARAGRLTEAFAAMGAQPLPAFLYTLGRWHPQLEQLRPGLTAEVVREVVRIGSWARPSWMGARVLLDW